MKFIFPIASSLVFIIGMSFVASWLLKKVNRVVWKWSALDVFCKWLPRTTAVFQLVWLSGIITGSGVLYLIGATSTTLLIFIIGIIILSVPFAWLLYKRADRKKKLRYDPGRRRFIKGVTGVFPVATLAFSSAGLANSFARVRVPVINLPVKDLPPALDGLKIAHLSDLHLGYYYELDELAATLTEVASHKPDIFFITGDVADELHLLGPALKLIAELNTPYNGYACVGNHEYYRGIEKIRRIFGKSRVPLLYEQTDMFYIKDEPVIVGGVDDPVTHRPDMQRFLDRTVEKTFSWAMNDVFKILMSHRPLSFNKAQKMGIQLTLAGHTHGGQLGFNGHSAFEFIPFEKYLWGSYQKEGASLYTSSGMGHWFPFRLGCPAEAPVLILQRV